MAAPNLDKVRGILEDIQNAAEISVEYKESGEQDDYGDDARMFDIKILAERALKLLED